MAEGNATGKRVYKANENRGTLKAIFNMDCASATSNKKELGAAEWHFVVSTDDFLNLYVQVLCKRNSADVSCNALCTIRLIRSKNDWVVKKNHCFSGEQMEQHFVIDCIDFPGGYDKIVASNGHINTYLANGKNLTIFMEVCLQNEAVELSAECEQLFSSSSTFGSDCVLLLEGKRCHVCKNYLSVHSGFFKAMFESCFSEKGKDEIELKGVDYNEFVQLLAIIYPTQYRIGAHNVEFVLKLADRFEMLYLVKSCEDFLLADDVISDGRKLIMAQNYHCKNLMEKISNSFTSGDELKNLKKDPVYDSLENETLGILCKKFIDTL